MLYHVVRLRQQYGEPIFVSENYDYCKAAADALREQAKGLNGAHGEQYRIDKVETVYTTMTLDEAVAEARAHADA
jgi:hypothetical protein